MWLEEKELRILIKEWCKEIKVKGWEGHKLFVKLKLLKHKIRDWAKVHFRDVEGQKTIILEEIQLIDSMEESTGKLTDEGRSKRIHLKEEFQRKVEEEIKWWQRSRCKWLAEGDKNTKCFHSLDCSKNRSNRITYLLDEEVRLEDKEDIVKHIEEYVVKHIGRTLRKDLSWITWNLIA